MRTLEEIKRDIDHAIGSNNAQALRELAMEIRALDTDSAEASAQNALGLAHVISGNYTQALDHYRSSLEIYERLGSREGVARVTGNIGTVHFNTSSYTLALEHYRSALAVYEALGDRMGVAVMIGNIAGVYYDTGDYLSALEHHRRAMEHHEELGDRAGLARITGNMAGVYYHTADYPSALEYYGRALALSKELGDGVGSALFTGGMGSVFAHTGDYTSALEYHRRALALHEGSGNRAGVALVTGNMGNAYFHSGDFASALEHHRRALEIYEELGARAGVVRVLGTMTSVLIKLDRCDEAAELMERQSTMQLDNPSVRAHYHANRALLEEYRQDLDAVHHHLKQALAISTEAGLRAESVEFHKNLRDLAQKRNDFAEYIEHNNEYQRLAEEIRGKETTQRMAMMEAERRMEGERRERDKERALLYGALPKSVADRMIRGEDVSGDHFDHAAVMFLDIVGFTSHTSSMPPSDVVKMLENIFRTIDAICDTHEVVKVKTIGDSYMCFRGDADASSNALSIAHVALDVMQHTFTWPNGDPLLFRVGIHIGPATAGVIGTQRLQYDVWGDTVNVASRMESSGEPGRVHVTEAFASELKRNTEYTIQNSITESDNQESHDVPLVTRNSSLETQLVTRNSSLVTIERGSFDIKGKGPMQTYWLECAS